MSTTEEALKQFISKEFLGKAQDPMLTSTTPLMGSGILDSLGVIMIVEFIESKFGVRIHAHETDPAHMGTIERIAKLIESRQAATRDRA